MNKSMELTQAAPICECGLCTDCMDPAEYARLMDIAIADAKAAGDLCNICGTIGVLTQGACYDCCRLCTQCGDEPRSLTSLVCDVCLAKTIKPVSNIPVRGGFDLPQWGITSATIGNMTNIDLSGNRRAKFKHLRHACGSDCGYCYQEACDWLHQDCIDRNVCVDCQEGLEETSEEIALKADTDGMMALTEYEQCYLEGSGKGRCPECIEEHQDAGAEQVYCHACSVAGDADRAIYHKWPACVVDVSQGKKFIYPTDNQVDKMVDTLREHPGLEEAAVDPASANCCRGPKSCANHIYDKTKAGCQECLEDATAAQAFVMRPLDAADCCCGPKHCVGKIEDFTTEECKKCNNITDA